MRYVLALLSLLGLVLVGSIAYAAGGSPVQPFLGRLIELLFSVLGVALSVIVTWAVTKALTALIRKTGLKLGEAERAQIDELLDRAIAYAEEQGHKAIASKASKLTMGEKAEAAGGYFLALAEQYKAPEWVRGKVRDLLEARLGTGR